VLDVLFQVSTEQANTECDHMISAAFVHTSNNHLHEKIYCWCGRTRSGFHWKAAFKAVILRCREVTVCNDSLAAVSSWMNGVAMLLIYLKKSRSHSSMQ